MAADKKYSSLEMHIIEILAKEIGISRMQLISFLLDEIKDKNMSQSGGITIVDQFVKYFVLTEV